MFRVCSVLISVSACLKNFLEECETGTVSSSFRQRVQLYSGQFKFICDTAYQSQ